MATAEGVGSSEPNELRRAGRQARRSISGPTRSNAERRLASHLRSLQLPVSASVGVYIADDGEPDLADFVAALRSGGNDLALPVPADDAGDFTMVFRPWEADDELTPGRFGIPCPPSRPPVEPDVVVVPLVRFDASLNRMGRGAGFYDRWLHGRRVVPIGTAFEVQRAPHLKPEPHDVAMAAIVTELGIRFAMPTGDRKSVV